MHYYKYIISNVIFLKIIYYLINFVNLKAGFYVISPDFPGNGKSGG